MFKKIEPLEFSKHQNFRLSTISSFAFSRNISIVKLSLSELRQASRFYPIVFLKDGTCIPQALLSLKGGENTFVDDAGNWTVPYIPACLRFYPFTLARIETKEGQEDQFALCLDPEAEHFKSGMGDPLFTADGQPVEFIKNHIFKALSVYYQELVTTEKLFAALNEKGLILDCTYKYTVDQVERSVDGFKSVAMQKLLTMDDGFLAGMIKNGTMGMVYEHTHSLNNFSNLLTLNP